MTHQEAVVFGDEFNRGIGNDLGHVGADFAVKNIDGFADFDLGGEVVLDGESGAAVMLLDAVIQDEFVALVDVKMVVFEVAEADFRTLEVLKNGNRATLLGGGLADPSHKLGHLVVGAVREVEAAAVDASHNDLFNLLGARNCRANGGEDFSTFK